jgi:hypothetical protein
VRKGMYEKALAKNKAEREKRARAKTPTPKAKTVTPKVKTPHPKFRLAINKYVNSLTNNERNVLKKKVCD